MGRVTASPESIEVAHVLPAGDSPGEILRRQARELIDEIPAAEMPTAIVFLEFLRERGAASLLGGLTGGTSVESTTPDRTSEELPRQHAHDDEEDLREEGAVAS